VQERNLRANLSIGASPIKMPGVNWLDSILLFQHDCLLGCSETVLNVYLLTLLGD
jgi:hypothetical protein